MMMLFPKVTVPGLDIDFHPDHKDPFHYYAIRSAPKVATDPEGNPSISYMLIARNADIAYASSENKEMVETQLGQLLLTVDLGLTPEEHKIATQYIGKMLADQRNRQRTFWSRLTKQTIPRSSRAPTIKISTPQWQKGVARLVTMEGLPDTFKKSSSPEVNPSLVASNAAAFYVTYGIEGSELVYQALTQGFAGEDKKGSTVRPLQLVVYYNMTGATLIPNMEIKLSASSVEIHRFLQSQWEHYKKQYQTGTYTRTKKFLGITVSKKSKTVRTGVSVTKSDIRRMTEEMWDTKVIKVEMTDFSALGASTEEAREANNQLKQTLIDMIVNTIIPQFFESALIEEKEEKEEDDDKNTTPGSGLPAGQGLTTADQYGQFMNRQEQTYYFAESRDASKVKTMSFHFKENRAIEFNANPQGVISVEMNKKEFESLIQYVDLTSPLIQMMQVQVSFNADFVVDNIHSGIVTLSYREKDHKSGVVRENRKSFQFKTGEEVYTFRVTMARNSKGELIDFYDAVAKINYKGTAEAPPAIELKRISDRALVISYERLGFVTVDLRAGDMDWSVIKDAIVELEYKAMPNKPDTRAEVRLSSDEISGNWKCFTYGKTSKEYRYRVRYIYQDGAESYTDWKDDTRDTLIVDDNLIGRVKANFDVFVDPRTVDSIKAEVLYEDKAHGVKEEYSNWFQSTDSWTWSTRLREGGDTAFKYRFVVVYKDSMVETTEWQKADSDEDIPVFRPTRIVKSLFVDGGGLDWSRWRLVYVNVAFEDGEYEKKEMIRLDEMDPMREFSVMAFNRENNKFTYTIRFARQGGGTISQPLSVNEDGLLILEDPAEEEDDF